MFIIVMILYGVSLIFAVIGGSYLGIYLSISNSEYLYSALKLFAIALIFVLAVQVIPVYDKKNRTTFYIDINKSKEETEEVLKRFLQKKSYSLGNWNQEEVYKNGNGILMGRKFLRYYFEDDKLVIEAWTTLIGMFWIVNKEFPVDDKWMLKVLKNQLAKLVDEIKVEVLK